MPKNSNQATVVSVTAEAAAHCPKTYEQLLAQVTALCKERDELKKQVPRWIPVTERLPEEGECVLSHFYEPIFSCYGIRVDRYRGENSWQIADDTVKVLHWMPLPEPPKEVESAIREY